MLTGVQYSIAAGDFAATVTGVGANLRQFSRSGVAVTVGYPADQLAPRGCGAVLVPWPNRVRSGRWRHDGADLQLALTEPAAGNAIHGLGRWARWTEVDRSAASVTLGLDVVPQTGWPFEIRAEVTYALDFDTGLTVTAHASNVGTVRAPFGAGFHPYVDLHGHPLDEVVVTLPAEQRLSTDEAGFPIGRQPVAGTRFDLRSGLRLGDLRLDDEFTDLARDADGRAEVTVRAGDAGARLWFDAAFEFVQLFTIEALVDGPAIAVEPMSCASNALNSQEGLAWLEPGLSWTGTWGLAPLSP